MTVIPEHAETICASILKDIGLVRVPGKKGHIKHFQECREIKQGKNTGKYEVKLLTKKQKKIIVHSDQIRMFPSS